MTSKYFELVAFIQTNGLKNDVSNVDKLLNHFFWISGKTRFQIKEAIAFQGEVKLSKLPKMVLEGAKLGQKRSFIPL